MPSCIVHGCTSSSKTKDPAPVLHAFPPEIENVRMWLQQTKQDFGNLREFSKKVSEAPRGSYRMCSLHFGTECYEIRGRSYFLKRGAVPTIFSPKKAPIEEKEEEPKTSLKRTKKSANVILAEMAAMDHNYAGPVQDPAQDVSASNQSCGSTSLIEESTVEVEIMPDSPTNSPVEPFVPKFAKRKQIKLPPPKRFVPRVTDFNPRPMHRSTNTDPYFGKTHRKNSANLRPKHFSVGVQCNLPILPPPSGEVKPRQAMPPIATEGLSRRSIRKMVLHRGKVYVML
ncbi:uncharacterized protein ACNLHF_014314 isoform 1-T1 [Anomaloglossus baeobatrachus]|uniref:uncharacterized protein LOC142301129 n=1 Tax=Anomaloglossus baeobatrachus TaxID=238106 RepID=UPI003F50034B